MSASHIIIYNSKVSSSEYIKRLFTIFMSDNWAWFVFPVVAIASLSVLNLKFIIVALMVVFIVIPMVLSLLYFNYALSNEALITITEKYVELKVEGITFKPLQDNSKSCNYEWDYFNKAKFYPWGIVLQPEKRYRILILPSSAFENEKQRSECIAFIKHNLLQ